MRKLHLKLEALDVESFATGGGAGERGTVQGKASEIGTCDCSLAACLETDPGGYNGGGDDATRAKFCTHAGSCVGATCRDHTCGGYTCHHTDGGGISVCWGCDTHYDCTITCTS